MYRVLLFILVFSFTLAGGVSENHFKVFFLSSAYSQEEPEEGGEERNSEQENTEEGVPGEENTEGQGTESESNGEENAENEEGVQEEENAEEEAEETPVTPEETNLFSTKDFGKGGYVSLWKVFLAILVYLCWVHTTDWLSSDCQEYKFGVGRWVPIIYGSFLGALMLFWIIPVFWVGFPLLLLTYLVPLIIYVRKRNAVVSDGEKVMTAEHLQYWLADHLSMVGIKMAVKAKKDKHASGPPIVLNSFGGTIKENEQRRIAAQHHPGFRDARQLLADGLGQEAEVIVLDFSQTGVTIKYQVDGAWHAGHSMEREKADPALEALKLLCGLNSQERRRKQEGKFKATYEYQYTFPEDRLKIKQVQEEIERTPEDDLVRHKELKREMQVAKESKRPPETRKKDVTPKFISQGTQTGERVIVQFEVEKTVFKTPAELGMNEKTQQEVLTHLASEKGIFIFAAPKAGGLRTTMTVMLGKTDRYCRDFIAIDDGEHHYEEVENIPVEVSPAKTPEEWKQYLRSVFLKEPNVVLLRDITCGEMLDAVTEELSESDRFFITSVRAKDGAEALLRLMLTKCDAEKFVENVNAVLTQRLARRLCDHCKEMYQPAPQLLRQLGFPADKEVMFYRPPQVDEKQTPCPECRGIGYKGRVAIYELAVPGDVTREILSKQPKLELVRKALRKDGNRSMMEEGIQLVVKGTTSIQELKRALE